LYQRDAAREIFTPRVVTQVWHIVVHRSSLENRNPRAVEHCASVARSGANQRLSEKICLTPMPRFARPDTRPVYLRYRAVWGMLRESLEAVLAEAGWRPVLPSR
jgi:hypothetical protein